MKREGRRPQVAQKPDVNVFVGAYLAKAKSSRLFDGVSFGFCLVRNVMHT